MFNCSFRRRSLKAVIVLTLALGGACSFGVGSFGIDRCDAAIVAYLSETRQVVGERFESDLVMSGSADMIGDEIELISLDVVRSTVKTVPLADFTLVRFDAAPRFADWQGDQQFGVNPGFESSIALDSFASGTAVPFPIVNTNPFEVGILTFDYSGLGLQIGDSITLNVFGQNDGTTTRTTSVAIRPSGSTMTTLVNPEFTSEAGSEQSTFTLSTTVPEPGGVIMLAAGVLAIVTRRRKRSALRGA